MAEDQVIAPAVPAGEPAKAGPGAVRIHRHVIATIARLAALKAPGVAGFSPTFGEGLARLIGRKADDHGLRVRGRKDRVALDLNVVIHHGVSLPEVARRIQDEVRRDVEHMTGKTVTAVNVIIQSLQFPSESRTVAEEGSAR